MQPLRRTAVTAARKTRTTLPRSQRRYAHDKHAHGHGHEPVNESFGPAFWGSLALVPASYIVYSMSRPNGDEKPYFSQLIEKYTNWEETWSARNDLHVKMIEQAARDRTLFVNTRPQDHVDLKFPEIFNVGSPYNVPAGSQVNLDKVIEKYKKEAYENNERKLEALGNGTIKSEQPLERSTKNPPNL
ncbi:hypothetical protein K469DRAFT_705481 [Zopfia rhizophila CBS 207.26]|uniref:NADH-ubiquinone oxidoreductase 17.8 kDa subunit n=1 Tax=Zopfia rhizophila CBS 207.26 TaxID=1314779 RepID=A0A6A6E829_9PEZI|nr:hypothetical protein K469DRAFT_705481 [Zopfia rhizophila CBS 207.26]